MSRVGKYPVAVPQGTTVTIDGQVVKAKGKLGERSLTVPDQVEVVLEDGSVVLRPRNEDKEGRMMWGTARSLTQSLVTGVTDGFSRNLEINGVGYRAAVEGKNLKLQLGFSHDVLYPIPDDVKIVCERPTAIQVTGIDKQRVGQIASEIRAFRKPEPYKGKGIKYSDEFIFRKEGKKK